MTRMTTTILGPLKSKFNCWIRIRDPHSEYGSRIRIPGSAEYRSNADPDPKHCRFALFSAFSAASLSLIFCLQVGQSLYLTPTPWCSIFAVRNRGRAGSSSCLLHTPANVRRCQFQKKKSNIHSLASHTPNPGTFSWPLLRGMGRNSSRTRHDRLSAPVRADWSFFL